MDYAFVPGIGNKGLEELAAFLTGQVDVTHLASDTSTLSGFLSFVAHDATDPVHNLVIGADANFGGGLNLALDDHTSVPATYEKILACTSIQIPTSIREADTSVLLKYGGLGDPKFGAILTALKKALGNPSRLTAPRYPHVVDITEDENKLKTYWEYMTYSFLIPGNEGGQPITSRDSLIDKAVGSHFQFVNHTDIPREVWQGWIPEDLKFTDYFNNHYPVFILLSAPQAIPRLYHRTIVGARSPQPLPVLESNDAPPSVEDIVATQNTIKGLLSSRPDCKANHPYPLFKRYGYNDLDELVKAFKWTITTNNGSTLKYALQYVGTRYLYWISVPITDPGTGKLIGNYYPLSGDVILNFNEISDPYDMFAKV